MEQRYPQYNQTLEILDRMEKEGSVMIIRPSRDPKIGRMEKKREKVLDVYQLGYGDAMEKIEQVKEFLHTDCL